MLHTCFLALSLLSAAAPASRLTIAVAPFTTASTSEYEWVGPALAQALSLRVLLQPRLNSITLRQVESVLRDENIDPNNVVEPAYSSQLGRQLGADVVVMGTFVAAWPDVEVLVKVLDAASGKVKVTQSINGDLCMLIDLEAQVAEVLAKAIEPEKLDTRVGTFGTVVLRAWREATLAQRTLAWQSLGPVAADPATPLSLPGTAVQEAKRHLETAVALDPTYGDAWAYLGLVQALLGNTAQAAESFRKARAASKDTNPSAVLASAFVSMRQGRFEEALSMLKDGVDHSPGFLHARGYLGELYNHLGRHKEALAAFDSYLQIAPLQPWVLAQRGYTKSKLSDHVGAIADTIKAVDLVPNSPSLLIQLASRYIDAGKLIGAEDALRHALDAHPREARIYARLGYVYLLQGKDDLAIAISEKALLTAEFTNRLRDRAYAHLNLARAYGHQGKLDRAFESLTAAKGEDATVPFSEIAQDPKLDSLRKDPRYQKLGMP
jgi:tetratricopeptide (TPR) repeat protein/TolB-like protein